MKPRVAMLRSYSSALAALCALTALTVHADEDRPFLPRILISSTIPANGDLNPYGVAFVPRDFPGGGALRPGDVLVSNFNASSNLQGTGTTVIKFTPDGAVTPSVPVGQNGSAATFFQSRPTGLSTALGVLRRGYVLVGNVPTTDGTVNTIANGSLQIIDRNGHLVTTLVDPVFLDSPWDLTLDDDGDHALLFVANVLSGTVSRLELGVGPSTVTVLNRAQIAKGYKHEPNAAALVLGPTGLAFDDRRDLLYVASTDDNAIFAVLHAGHASSAVTKGTLVFADPHLRGPLGLSFAPNGHLLTANGDAVNADPAHPSEIVEFTREGRFVREFNIDAGEAAAFGLTAVLSAETRFNFAHVNDATNAVAVYRLSEE
ncbi:MAG: hypothetical protein JO341_04915 [Gammaproteobacteria bacterium]|nr:hypothetical protein [Gammaproteobacteria bacterium]